MQKLIRKRSSERLQQLKLATSPDEIRQAQELRYRVFKEEYGASLQDNNGLDEDYFDAFCKHLIVINQETGDVIATTRFLLKEGAEKAGKYYSETEFDLTPLKRSGRYIMELGRTCVHPDYRSGSTLSTLWSGVANQFIESGHDMLIGCGSISMQDNGARVWSIYEHLRENHLSEAACQTNPLRQVPHLAERKPSNSNISSSDIPPLIRAYMRLGAKICGEPCWDPEFRCADFLILLKFEDLAERYKRHFFKNS